MKFKATAIALSLALVGCQQSEESAKTQTAEPATKTAAAKTEQAKADGLAEKDKMAYGLGVSMASNITHFNDTYKALDMDMEVFKQGFLDQLNKQSKLTPEEALQQAQIFGQKLRFAQQQQIQEEQASLKAENTKFLEENLTKGFTQTESGLQYKVLTPAPEGAAKPTASDTVKVHYTGTFTDGEKFDSSVDKGTPFTFSLKGGVIQGWLEGVKLMEVGSKYQFAIPPELGYGYQSGPKPGAILMFDVELLEIVKPEGEESK